MSSSVFESIMQGLSEAAEYQQGKVKARKVKLAEKSAVSFNFGDVKRTHSSADMGRLLATAR